MISCLGDLAGQGESLTVGKKVTCGEALIRLLAEYDVDTVFGIPPVGVDSLNPDFPLLARAFGCEGVLPGSLDEVTASIERALHTPRPTLIEVHQGAEWLA